MEWEWILRHVVSIVRLLSTLGPEGPSSVTVATN